MNELLNSETYTWNTDVIASDVLWNVDVNNQIKQYANDNAWKADTANSYTSFNSAYWTIVDGVPTWNTLND